ncbi:MAG: hypothetical protein JSV92_03000 [archaeon]|nr:MAG: hypothetical protein JSV92_03000 [archaeon]
MSFIDLDDFLIKPLKAREFADGNPEYFKREIESRDPCWTNFYIKANGKFLRLFHLSEKNGKAEGHFNQFIDNIFMELVKDEKSMKVFLGKGGFTVEATEKPFLKQEPLDESWNFDGKQDYAPSESIDFGLKKKEIHWLACNNYGTIKKFKVGGFNRSVFFAYKFLLDKYDTNQPNRNKIKIGKIPIAVYKPGDDKWEPLSENFIKLMESYHKKINKPKYVKVRRDRLHRRVSKYKKINNPERVIRHLLLPKNMEMDEFEKHPKSYLCEDGSTYHQSDSQIPMNVDKLLSIKGDHFGVTSPIPQNFTIN